MPLGPKGSGAFPIWDKSRNLAVMLAVRGMFWLRLRESEALEMWREWRSWDLMRYSPESTVFDPTKGGEVQGLPTQQSLTGCRPSR